MRVGRAKTRATVLAVTALAAAATVPMTSAGAATTAPGEAARAVPTGKFKQLDVPAGMKFTPASVKDSAKVKVILELAGDSVGDKIAAATDAGRSLSNADRSAARSRIVSSQQAVQDAVKARGGQVLATYQDAYNGLAVKVSRGDLAALRALPGVVSVQAVGMHKLDNVTSVKYIGGKQAWNVTGVTGKGTKVAIIDTGIDYTHANFGGKGTVAAYDNNDRDVIEAGTFPTSKVVGGYDFVGDAYAAEDPDNDVPNPDADPLDCEGHGSHVAGSAAGLGVTEGGDTYGGPYDGTTYDHSFKIGPGTAPDAKLYAYKVFGCAGSVDDAVIISALNRALKDKIDVVNMSLGSSFGTSGTAETDTVDTISKAGVMVVASAGNSGAGAYLSGAPASADRALSVAAVDARSTLAGAHAEFSKTTDELDLQNSNEADFEEGLTLPVKVLRDANGDISLGCDASDYAGAQDKLVVTQRGICDRVTRAKLGQQAGAAAVLLVDNSPNYPPVEGPIEGVTIPFFGAPGTDAVKATLNAADGGTVTLTKTQLDNPGFGRAASFTSAGPRNGDSAVKPDISAPGVSVVSTGVGTGNGAVTESGTSMASPLTAGAAALVIDRHPSWLPERTKAALMNTASKNLLKDYSVPIEGSGVVQVQKAVETRSLILAGKGQSTLSFGAEELSGTYHETIPMKIVNTSDKAITYDIASQFEGEQLGASIKVPSPVTVAGHDTKTVDVTLGLSKADIAALPDAEASQYGLLVSIRGAVVATPTSGGYPLRVPFLVAPRGLSDVEAGTATAPVKQSSTRYSTKVPVSNTGVHAGNADVYAWSRSSGRDSDIAAANDIRAVGVKSLPATELVTGAADSDRALFFAVNKYGAQSTASTQEIDIPVDFDGDGKTERYIVGIDDGIFFGGGAADGVFIAATVDLDNNVLNAFLVGTTAPMNGSTVVLPALASDLKVSGTNPAFGFSAATFDLFGTDTDATRGAAFNAYKPSVSTGDFASLAPGESGKIGLTFDPAAAAAEHTAGWMFVTMDDAAGAPQADLVKRPAVK